MKKLIAFDLDGTLAPSKSHFEPRMVEMFNKLLETHQVCVISGANYDEKRDTPLEDHCFSGAVYSPTGGVDTSCFKESQLGSGDSSA